MEHFKVGQKVQALDELSRWENARVVDINTEEKLVLVNFTGWGEEYDDWMPTTKVRMPVNGFQSELGKLTAMRD